MQELLLRVVEFSVELGVVTAAVVVVAVGLSIAILYPLGAYRSKKATIIIPALLSIIIGACGPEDHTNILEWVYYILPNFIISPTFVSILCYWKRQREKKKPGK